MGKSGRPGYAGSLPCLELCCQFSVWECDGGRFSGKVARFGDRKHRTTYVRRDERINWWFVDRNLGVDWGTVNCGRQFALTFGLWRVNHETKSRIMVPALGRLDI